MMKLSHLTPDLELCREPAVLAHVIEINIIEEVSFKALLLLLIVHPPKEEAAVVGSSGHGEAGPGRGFHPRGAEPAPAPPVCKGENKCQLSTGGSCWLCAFQSLPGFQQGIPAPVWMFSWYPQGIVRAVWNKETVGRVCIFSGGWSSGKA